MRAGDAGSHVSALGACRNEGNKRVDSDYCYLPCDQKGCFLGHSRGRLTDRRERQKKRMDVVRQKGENKSCIKKNTKVYRIKERGGRIRIAGGEGEEEKEDEKE